MWRGWGEGGGDEEEVARARARERGAEEKDAEGSAARLLREAAVRESYASRPATTSSCSSFPSASRPSRGAGGASGMALTERRGGGENEAGARAGG